MSFQIDSGIDSRSDPESIIKIMMYFLWMNVHCYINVLVDDSDIDENSKKIIDLMKVYKMMRNLKKNWPSRYMSPNALLVLSAHKRYNYITKQMISMQSPVMLSCTADLSSANNIFVKAVLNNNFEIAFKFLNSVPAEVAYTNIFEDRQVLERLMNSEHIHEFLLTLAKCKEEVATVIQTKFEKSGRMKTSSTNIGCMFVSYYSPFDIDEDIKSDKVQDENDGESNESDDPDYEEWIFYSYYQAKNVYSQVGKNIDIFNIMFYDNGYVLDELVNILSVDEIKELNKLGYVIGQYIHQNNWWKATGEYIPRLNGRYNREEVNSRPKCVNTNSELRIRNDLNLQNKEGSIACALKYALFQYKAVDGANENMVDYLVSELALKKDDIELLVPEIIWMLLKCFPIDHKHIKAFLPNDKEYRDYILFKRDIKVVPKVGKDAYEEYYSPSIRYLIWGDCAELILSKPDILKEVLSMLEKEMDIGDSYRLAKKTRESVYTCLFKACFKLDKHQSVKEQIIESASQSSNSKIVEERYSFDPYDEKNLIKMHAVFYKLVHVKSEDPVEN